MKDTTLSAEALARALASLPGWTASVAGISKLFDFPSYPDAIAAITRIGFAAEAADHHPDLVVKWKRVTVVLFTHDAGGVTEKDVDLARRIDALCAGRLA